MKLFRYQNFIKESKEDIDSICSKCGLYGIRNYTINDDFTIDVDGDVNLFKIGISEIPLKFGKVSGNFNCSGNKLESLEGSPEKVGGYFVCSENKLTSLSGAPREVNGHFSCHDNQLKSLSGAPREVGKHFFCSDNQLTSLEGAPREVGGDFDCYGNKLTSLEGISKYISVGIYCYNNQIRDVRGVKDGWRGVFWIEGNPVHEIFKLFPKNRWDEVIEYLNEHEAIRDDKVVILQALELVFYEMSLEVPEIEEIKGYEIQF